MTSVVQFVGLWVIAAAVASCYKGSQNGETESVSAGASEGDSEPTTGADPKELLGEDEDGDGLRDDVAQFIEENYGRDIRVKHGLFRYAKGITGIMLSTTKEGSNTQFSEVAQGMDCVDEILGDDAEKLLLQIHDKVTNTRDRFSAYWEADKRGGSQMIALPDSVDLEIACSGG